MTAPDLDALIEHLLDAERRLIAAFARVGVANGTLADMRLLTNAAIALRKQGDALVQLREQRDEWHKAWIGMEKRAERAEAEVLILRNDLATYAERIAALEAERDALAKDAELLMLDLSSAWFYGNWKAETYTEREMQEIMERQGYWPTSEPELVTRRVAIDAAKEKQT